MRPVYLEMAAFGSYAGVCSIDFSQQKEGIFLITGETGSGKTTIFDAMTFALYGKSSGGKKEGRMMRSQYAAKEDETYVDFSFYYNADRIRVRRSPEYNRLHHQKNGKDVWRAEKETVALYINDVISDLNKKTEINNKIVELLGLDFYQFTQIVMIAQGDFMKLLTADTKEKKGIFSRLFHTSIYQQIAEELKNSYAEEHRRDEDCKSRYHEQLRRIPAQLLSQEEREYPIDRAKELGQKLQESCKKQFQEYHRRQETLTQEKALYEKEYEEHTKARQMLDQFERQDHHWEKLRAWEKKAKGIQTLKQEADRHVADMETVARGEADSGVLREAASDLSGLSVRELTDELEKIRLLCEELPGRKKKIAQKERKLRLLQELVSRYPKLAKQMENEQAQMFLQKQAQENTQKAQENKRQLQQVYERKNEQYFYGQAGILADHLNDGEPCPVCGSSSHPHPAKKRTDMPTERDLKDAKASVEKAERNWQKEIENERKAAAAAQQARAVTEQTRTELCERLVSSEGESESEAKTNPFADENGDVRSRAWTVLRDSKKTPEDIRRLLRETEKEAAGIQKELDEERHHYLILTLRRQELVRQAQELCGTFESEGKSLRAVTEEYEKAVAGLVRPDAEQMKQKKQQLEAKKQQLYAEQDEISALRYSVQDLQEKIHDLNALYEEYQGIRTELQTLRTLNETASGQLSGQAKIDFETYVQRRYLQRILQAANRRFLEMTMGQYALMLKNLEEVGNRSNEGLDLYVHSPVTDSDRDIRTLSGGESFMAALSMALGLADVVMQTSGSYRIEMMFVDEGFGSLDDVSREKAIRVLQDLTGERTMVGIISHVTELKERIDRKLIVSKTERGSSAHWALE